MRKISLTTVVAHELWHWSCRVIGQFFRILADRIVEYRKDGTIIQGADHSLAIPERALDGFLAVVNP